MPTINEVKPGDEIELKPGDLPPVILPDAVPAMGGFPGMGGPPRPPGGLPVMMSGSEPAAVPSFDEDEDDEDLDESLGERLLGLTEMLPESLRHLTVKVLTTSVSSTKWLYSAGRTGMWVIASSAAILALPVMFESERAQMEEQQIQQQRQILLGPNAAVSGMGAGGLMPSAMPQVAPPPPPQAHR